MPEKVLWREFYIHKYIQIYIYKYICTHSIYCLHFIGVFIRIILS